MRTNDLWLCALQITEVVSDLSISGESVSGIALNCKTELKLSSLKSVLKESAVVKS